MLEIKLNVHQTDTSNSVCVSQVGGEALVAEDDHVRGDVLLAVRLPERA